LPLAIPSALRSSLSGRHRSVHDDPTTPLFEFRLRLGPCPAKPSRHCTRNVGSSHGLCFPTAHQASKVHFSRAKACPLCSVLRVWAPSRRFSPFDAVPALFHAGGAHGICPSELSPLGRFPGVSTRVSPPTVSPSGIPRRPKTSGRPAGPRFLGFGPSESPSRCSGCLAHRSPDAPLGFALPGSSGQGLVPDFAGTPLSRFAEFGYYAGLARAAESQSVLAWPHRSTVKTPLRMGQPS